MKKTALLFAAACVAVLSVAACAGIAPPARPMPQYTYTQYPPILLNVASIQVLDYIPTMQQGHVEHLMPQPLPVGVREWAQSRFRAVGVDGTAYITAKEATLIARDLDRTSGIKGVFTIDQAERYDGRIIVEMRIEGRATEPNGTGVVKVERGQTMSEKASVQDRDRMWTEMEEKMISDLDASTMQMLENRLSFAVKR